MGFAGAEKALIAASPFINGHLSRVGWNCLRLVWAPFLPLSSAFLVVLFKGKMPKLLSLLKARLELALVSGQNKLGASPDSGKEIPPLDGWCSIHIQWTP